ncbi:MAG: hypothetical protein ABI690_18205 [Chloroflexota bacterium]
MMHVVRKGNLSFNQKVSAALVVGATARGGMTNDPKVLKRGQNK